MTDKKITKAQAKLKVVKTAKLADEERKKLQADIAYLQKVAGQHWQALQQYRSSNVFVRLWRALRG